VKDTQAESARLRCRHIQMLCVALVVIVLASLLEVHSDQRVALSCLPGWPLPEICLSRKIFGVTCPGCGLTRSFIYLAHGDLSASWNVHRVGWLLALSVVLQLPYRIFALWTGNYVPLGTTVPRLFGSLLILLLFVNWLVNVVLQNLH
jgi:hypothetical protein